MRKVLATDLDGTLFYPRRKISMIAKRNYRMLEGHFAKQGKVVIVTGRNVPFSKKVAKKLMETTYIPGPNDCLSLLYDCLEAAGVPLDNLGQWPVWAFERNIDKTTVILE